MCCITSVEARSWHRGGSYAQVVTTDPKEILLPFRNPTGNRCLTDPSRLRGISAYREIEREFAIGDRIQFTAPNRALQVANRGPRHDSADRRKPQYQRPHGRWQGQNRYIQYRRNAALRPRLCRDLAQFPGTHRRACPGQHGYQCSPGTHQQPLCLCSLSLALRMTRRFIPTTLPRLPKASAVMSPRLRAIDFGKARSPVANVGLEQAAAALTKIPAAGAWVRTLRFRQGQNSHGNHRLPLQGVASRYEGGLGSTRSADSVETTTLHRQHSVRTDCRNYALLWLLAHIVLQGTRNK